MGEEEEGGVWSDDACKQCIGCFCLEDLFKLVLGSCEIQL